MNGNRIRQACRLGLVAATTGGVLLGLGGCATVIRGTTEKIAFESVPSGALVRLSNGFTGHTPVTFTVARKGDLTVAVALEGYEPMQVTLRATMGRGGTAANVAGNTAAAAGSVVLMASSVTVEGAGITAPVVAAGLATPLAVVGGAVLVGGVVTDIRSGAMLSHGQGPYRFILKPRPPPTPGGATPERTDPKEQK